MDVVEFAPGGYRYIAAAFQFSGGVAALTGHRITRVRFQSPVPLAAGFRRIEAMLTAAGRPLTALCACELRSPAPFTEAGFRAFNEVYVVTLKAWGLFADGDNPVARSNVCPTIDPPGEPSFHAFSFTEVEPNAPASFVISGCAEAEEDGATYRIVSLNDTSVTGMRNKARFVVGDMERRLAALGVAPSDVTATQLYTVEDVHPFLADDIMRHGVAPAGLTWQYARPPMVGLEFEMDCRGVFHERVVR